MPNSQQPKLSLRDRRRRLVWVKVAAGSAVVALSLIAVWFLARIPATTIASIEVKGTLIVSADEVKKLVEEKLDGSYAYWIPYRNSLLFPKRNIENAVAIAFPPLAKITISRNGFNALTVTTEERMATALWCDGATEEEACYSIDKNGFIFASATDATPTIRFYGALSSVPIGSTYLDGGFASLNTLVTGIASSIHRIPETVIVDGTSNDVELAFADGGVLKFVRTTSNQRATLENIASVFASQSFKKNKEFEYADFRFGDKVYIKFKGE